jgi:aspartate ammonia-lyase
MTTYPRTLTDLASMLEHVANSLAEINLPAYGVSLFGAAGYTEDAQREVANIAGELQQLSDRLNDTLLYSDASENLHPAIAQYLDGVPAKGGQ